MSHSAMPTGPSPALSTPMPAPVAVMSCADPDCLNCLVAETGAKTICQMVGVNYDTLPDEVRGHYAAVASEVMAAMSEHLLRAAAAAEVVDEAVDLKEAVSDLRETIGGAR